MSRRARALAAAVVTAGSLLLGTTTPLPAYAVMAQQAPDEPNKKPGDQRKPAKPKPDRTAPAAPALGTPDVDPGGEVSLPVRAEQGSRVVVREEGGSVVATGTGTGSTQTLAWTTSDGEHQYAVTATDRAGNSSRPSTVTVDVDATPPPLTRLRTVPGTPADSRSRVAFTTDPGSSYQVSVDGTVVREGAAEEDRVSLLLDVADGPHQVEVTVSDDIGNATAGTEPLRVRIPRLEVTTTLTSEVTARTQVIRVRATPNATRGLVRVSDEQTTRFRLKDGRATVRLRLTDGTYDDVTVTVRDTQGRTGEDTLAEVAVDTTPPEVAVVPDSQAAAEGTLRAVVTTEPGATVAWRLLDSTGDVAASGEAVAETGEATIERDVEEGSYRLVVTATDRFDRTASARAPTSIADDPMPVAMKVLLVAGLVAAGVVLLYVLFLLVRRIAGRAGPARTRWSGARAHRRAVRAEALAAREQEAALEAVEASRRRRHDTLAAFLGTVGSDESLPAPAGLGLLPDERVLHSVSGQLYEAVADDGDDLVLEGHDGSLVITNRRIAFVGDVTRDWWEGLIDEMVHQGDDRTVLRRWRDDSWSGITYDDLEATRLHLDLVMAEQRGTRHDYLDGVEEELRTLEHPRPAEV